MKKKLILLFVLGWLPFIVMAKGKEKVLNISDLPEDMQFSLKMFEWAIMNRDTNMVLTLMDRDYRDHQWDKYLQKNTPFFLNEIFCGLQTGTDQTRCIIFGNIQIFKIIKIEKKNKKSFKITYRIKTNEREITTTLEFMGKKRRVFGPVGSMGFSQLGGL